MKTITFSHRQFFQVIFSVLSLLVLACLFFPLVTLGADFVPLVKLPGVTQTQPGGLANYLNKIYLFLIVVGSIIAAIRISIAGAEYAFTDIVTSKEDAKKHIYGVLIGLAILLIPFIVLSTIYPALTSLDILGNAGALKSTINKTLPGTPSTNGLSVANATNQEAAKLNNECKGGMTMSGSVLCCSDINYTGPHKCTGDQKPTDANNTLGIDTLRVYGSQEEIKNYIAAQVDLIRTEDGVAPKYNFVGLSTASLENASCDLYLTGSKPIFFKVTGANNLKVPQNYLVCVK